MWMPDDLPAQAIANVAAWLHDESCNDGDTLMCGRWQAALGHRDVSPEPHIPHIRHYRDMASEVLEAAAPYIAAQAATAERQRIAQELLAEADRGRKTGLDRIALRAFAAHLLDGQP